MNELKFLEDIYIKFRETHYACKNVEMNDLKSTTANYPSSGFSRVTANGLNFRIINLLMEFWGVHLTWLDCKHRSGAWVEVACSAGVFWVGETLFVFVILL